ncbi:MAG: PAS domain S-box protein [Proteobacteria bacterium]|nr:PAS domain S-box protein [Pseudomonadota bacterium]
MNPHLNETLEFQHALLDYLGDNSREGIMIVDGNDRLVFHNRRFQEMWGIPPRVLASGSGEILCQFLLDKIVHPLQLREMADRGVRERLGADKRRVDLKDGRSFEAYSTPVNAGDGTGLDCAWNFYDATLSKRANQRIKQAEQRQRAMLEHLPAGAILTSGPEQTMLYQNRRFVEMFGYAMEEFPTVEDWRHLAFPDPKYREWIVGEWDSRMADAARQDMEIDPMEVNITAKDGTVWFIRIHATVVDGLILVTFFDLANRQKAKEALHKKTQALDGFFEVSMDLLCIADTGGYFQQLNPAWGQLLGYTCDELKARPFIEFVHPADREETLRATSQLTSQKEVKNFINRYQCKEGSYRWLEWQAVPAGNIIYAAARDITERKQAEEAISRHGEELEERVKARTAELHQANLALREVTERLTLATQAASMGVWDLDFNSRLVTWDDKMFQIYGLPKIVPMPDETWKNTVHPEDFAKAWASLSQTIENKDYDAVEFRIIRPDGQTRWIAAAQGVVLDDAGEVTRLVGTCTDITGRKAAQAKIIASERHFRAFFERPLVGMATISPATNWLDVNDQLCQMLGFSREELLQKTWEELTYPVDEAKNRTQLRLISVGEIDNYMINNRCLRKDGTILYAQNSVSCLRKPDGSVDYLVVLVVDVTAQHQAQEELRLAAHHDVLTQLPNRRLLVDRLQQAVAKTKRHGGVLAVCYLDLDGFKAVNDQLGHAAGDQLLIEVAKRLKSYVRGADTVARLGGDEFVILLSTVSNEDECRQVLVRVLNTVAAPYTIAGSEQSGISTSIGVTLFPEDNTDPEILLRHADHAMYAAKQSGRNRVVFFDRGEHGKLFPELGKVR